MAVGDVVLIKDENLPRNQWHLGRYIDDHGHVRKVKLPFRNPSLDRNGRRQEPTFYLERPISQAGPAARDRGIPHRGAKMTIVSLQNISLKCIENLSRTPPFRMHVDKGILSDMKFLENLC